MTNSITSFFQYKSSTVDITHPLRQAFMLGMSVFSVICITWKSSLLSRLHGACSLGVLGVELETITHLQGEGGDSHPEEVRMKL